MTLAVGFFDGVHLGHRAILDGARTVLTFRSHPLALLAPEKAPALVMSTDERLIRLGEGGRVVRAVDFTPKFSAMSPEAFADWLKRHFPEVRTVRCGANWTFGAGGKGTPDFLRAHGLDVSVVPYAEVDGERVSSSRIRSALSAGDVALAARLLGRLYAVTGPVVPGKGQGRKLGFPTLNIAFDPTVFAPPLKRGVYTVETSFGRGVTNWGTAPTFGSEAWEAPVLEVHLTGKAPEEPPRSLNVRFLGFIRPEKTFDGLGALHDAILSDIAACAETPNPL